MTTITENTASLTQSIDLLGCSPSEHGVQTPSPKCEIVKFLPIEIQNKIFFYSFVHPTSIIIKNNIASAGDDSKQFIKPLTCIETNWKYFKYIIDEGNAIDTSEKDWLSLYED